MTDKKISLRDPFPEHQIGKKPAPTRAQTEAVKANYRAGIRCALCGQWHHPGVAHLDYIGHAALTDRLLDVDEGWNWEPCAWNENGLPKLDENRGLWIKLTVQGVTRLGYGFAEGESGRKSAGDLMKEIIGDALRNAAMRFGAGLDLWHKGTLHLDDDADDAPTEKPAAVKKDKPAPKSTDKVISAAQHKKLEAALNELGLDRENFRQWVAIHCDGELKHLNELPAWLISPLFENDCERLKQWANVEQTIAQNKADRQRAIVWMCNASKNKCQHFLDMSPALADKLIDKLTETTA